MNLFKAKTADELEEKLMNIVNGFSHKVGLKDEVTTKIKNAEGHIKLGTMGGLGIGVLGVMGGIASIPLVPAIATTAVIGSLTVAGAAILGGGAGMSVGLAYAGIGKLYAKYQESKLGDITSKIFEEHRMKMEDNRFENKFSQKFHTDTNYAHYSGNLDIHSIVQAVKKGDMEQARGIVKEMVAQTDLPESKITKKAPLFKTPVADDMNQKLGKFFDEYISKLVGDEHGNQVMKRDSKMGYGMLAAAAAAMGSAAGLVTLASPAIIGGALAVSVACMAYSGIQKLMKTGLEQKGAISFELEANRHIHRVAHDLNIDANDLMSIQSIAKDNNASHKEMKEKFVNDASTRLKNKVS